MPSSLLPDKEPTIAVGLMENAPSVCLELTGAYTLNGESIPAGTYAALSAAPGAVTLVDSCSVQVKQKPVLHFLPQAPAGCFMTLRDIPIGRDFHWHRLQDQRFQGEIILNTFGAGSITVINRIPLEGYLESVICSEMSPRSHGEFLKAHCVVSRSWILAQLERKKEAAGQASRADGLTWTYRGAHRHCDVCADDHCQRYHGTSRINEAAQRALRATRGEALVFANSVCDARFSKCCGGITESFATAWEDRDVPYLTPVADCPTEKAAFVPPLPDEKAAERFIRSRPQAYCVIADKEVLARILPDFDFETKSFFRWEVSLDQHALRDILLHKTGIDFGQIQTLVPLARGASGRLSRLKVCGTKAEQVFGKELEIRRILSPTHLYSSAFVVDAYGIRTGAPETFRLTGAGWGHGVGMCQIGAAGLAEQGACYQKIVRHYFRNASLKRLYA